MTITRERGHEAVQRLVNSHFNNANRARCSIPADRENDDDLVAFDYLAQLEAELATLRSENERLKAQLEHYQAGLSMYDECDCGHTRVEHCNLKRADGPDVWACSECTCPNFYLETQAGMPEGTQATQKGSE